MKVRKKRLLGKSGGGKQTRKITDRLLFLVVAQHASGALPVADLFLVPR